ncbi:MAG: hydroxyethylthiazole kinase [Thermoplasmata archaeon]|nr:hydroxyethylthiazole kinase [Thermoplasmata archaeon]
MEFYPDLKKIREIKPLIHHITNYVVMNDSANITLAIGASPIMAHAEEELEDLISIAGSLYINVGTLDRAWINSMLKAGKIAEKYNKPVLLDPVGMGASRLRNETVQLFLESFKIHVLKGNGGEMLSLYGIKGGTKGVDSLKDASIDVAVSISEKYDTTAVITGKTDYISDGKRIAEVRNGTDMFQKITGSGCMLGSVISSFLAVNSDTFISSIEGLVTFEIAGELAEKKSNGPGSFKEKLIDEIFNFEEYDYKFSKVSFYD